jgi:hypothetical protein
MEDLNESAIRNLTGKITALEADIVKIKSKCVHLSNQKKRTFHARSELIKIEVEDKKIAFDRTFVDKSLSDLKVIADSMDLSFVKCGGSLLSYLLEKLDELVRFLGVWSCIVVSAIFIAVPSILVRPLDYFLLNHGFITPYQQISVCAKRFVAYSILMLSGIVFVTEGMKLSYFGSSCVLTCFSHSSTMDAFILSYLVPCRHFTVAKKELFMIPYFAWLLIAFGGVPIDRSNRY